ncbi:MAG: CDP-diacylglycerol--glycerol-3-phosphate 3-phosphatidyltransferase [Candidatus Marinimicrobia bacterium]|nr:CDP-diacylglycerol--glycerol-3-phosphate 3-phosphatidyltransferase [Candidatus Neomarinimicrobiota bacterium]
MILPNQLTVLRIALTPAFFILLVYGDLSYNYFIATLIFAMASLTDLYDGYIARKYGTVTKWGTFVDPLADKLITGSALIGFVINGYLSLWMVLIVVARDIVVTLLRLYSLRKNKPLRTEIFAKWKTTFQFLLIAFILIYHNLVNNPFGYTLNPAIVRYINESGFTNAGMFVIVLITLFSGFRYYFGNRKVVRQMAIGIYRSLLNS